MPKTKEASAPPECSLEMLKKIVKTFFSCHDTRPWVPVPYGQTGQSEVATTVMNDELIAIAKSLQLNKVPSPDGILTIAVKTAIETSPDVFRMQMCLDKGEFPERWK